MACPIQQTAHDLQVRQAVRHRASPRCGGRASCETPLRFHNLPKRSVPEKGTVQEKTGEKLVKRGGGSDQSSTGAHPLGLRVTPCSL